MKKFRYLATKYKQHPESSLEIVSFVAPAEQIITWSGVPRKTELGYGGVPVNFQRALSEGRISELNDFFGDASNISPTSIVIAFREGCTSFTTGKPFNGLLDYACEEGVFELVFDNMEELPLEELLKIFKKQIECRLLESAPEIIVDEHGRNVEGGEELNAVKEEPGDTEESDEDTFVLYDSHLLDFYKYICSILEVADRNKLVSISEEDKSNLKDTIIALLKPAMIVDGQHRVIGAAALEKEIPFNVCAIVNSSWEEQVFQFIVVNQKAEPITPNFLSSITSTSLTSEEIANLRERLDRAGINVAEHEMMDLIDKSPDSPFRYMINFAILGETGKLPYPGIRGIAKRFRYMSGEPYRTFFKLYIAKDGIFHQKLKEWEEVHWSKYFFAFWKVFIEKYDTNVSVGELPLWSYESQLLKIKTLEVLQAAFFDWLLTTKYSLPSHMDEFKQIVMRWLSDVPRPFFSEEWKGIKFGSRETKDVIVQVFREIQRNPGYQFRRSRLFREKW